NDAKDKLALKVTVKEAGSYRLSLTKKLGDQTTDPYTLSFTIEPTKRPIPKLSSIEEQLDGKTYAFNDFSHPVELKPKGTANLTVNASSPEKDRVLFVLDRLKGTAVLNASKAVSSVTTKDANVDQPVAIALAEADITDKPTDLVVVDQWTMTPSSPATV